MTAEDLHALRAEVIAASERPHADLLDELSASSLRVMFNKVAPTDLQVGVASVLRVHLGSSHPTAREIVRVTDAFSAAVASIGNDIRRTAAAKQEPKRPVSAPDYGKTPVYAQVTGGNLIIMRPEPPEFVDAVGSNVDSTSARALDRLTNLLPESRQKDETLVVRAAVGAGRADRYALNKIARAAQLTGGLEVEWDSQREHSRGFVSLEHADELVKVLAETERSEEVVSIHGRLDGTRVKRRQFWIERADGDIGGLVDEAVMSRVVAFINQSVSAKVVRTITTTRSGKASRPSYRLIDIDIESAEES